MEFEWSKGKRIRFALTQTAVILLVLAVLLLCDPENGRALVDMFQTGRSLL